MYYHMYFTAQFFYTVNLIFYIVLTTKSTINPRHCMCDAHPLNRCCFHQWIYHQICDIASGKPQPQLPSQLNIATILWPILLNRRKCLTQIYCKTMGLNNSWEVVMTNANTRSNH